MLTCYIIDDETHAIKSLKTYVEKTPLLHLLGYNENPLAALASFQESSTYPDITFLDIDMPQISGLELSGMLNGHTAVVFTTAHPGFALEAFELNISDYLLKPIAYPRFLKCIQKLSEQVNAKRNSEKDPKEDFIYIQSEGKGKLIRIAINDIIVVESQKNYVAITTPVKKFLTYLTLTEIEEKLPPVFLRISKSFIVNTSKINLVEGNKIVLNASQERYAVGPGYRDAFTKHMKEHLVKTKRFQG